MVSNSMYNDKGSVLSEGKYSLHGEKSTYALPEFASPATATPMTNEVKKQGVFEFTQNCQNHTVCLTTEMKEISMPTINLKPLMHKVPPLLRLSSKDVFDPFVVSIGPYHHGKSELQIMQKLKPKAVQMFIEGSNRDSAFYLNKILETISDVRSYYVEGSTDKYDHAYLANMMLQDACFILKHEEMSSDPATIYQVGRFLFDYVFHDIHLLENQIPLSILKLLNYSISDGEGRTLLDDFLLTYVIGDWNHLKSKFGDDDNDDDPEEQPIHILELSRRTCYLPEDISILKHSKSSQSKLVYWLMSKFHKSDNTGDELEEEDIEEDYPDHSFSSAMDLKARGIHFKVNSSNEFYRLEDIKFKSSYFYGELQLPKWNVTIFTKVVLSNLLALENHLPEDQCVVTAYVNLMKILLQNTDDVKELREKKVLTNQLRTDEDLLQVFHNLPVTTWDTLPPFSDVLDEVEVYYRKRRNKWVGELIQTYFNSPWTIIALIAVAVLCLTIVQTYFTIHPRP